MGLLMLMGDSGFNVRSELFGAGEVGAWYDPSDFSTMWQDSGKTTPVTAAGDPVGYIADKSGRGNDARQTTSGQRPTLQTSGGLWYLSFDGSDDSLVTNSVDFSATDEMTVIAGVRKLSDGDDGMLLELSSNVNASNGSFYITAPEVSSLLSYASLSRGDSAAATPQRTSLTGSAAPDTCVLSVSHDISNDLSTIRRNATAGTSATGEKGSGNFGNHILYIGRRGGSSVPFNGHIYQLIIRGKTTPTGKLLEAERFVARKTGVSF